MMSCSKIGGKIRYTDCQVINVHKIRDVAPSPAMVFSILSKVGIR
jgi:hypothetical protein